MQVTNLSGRGTAAFAIVNMIPKSGSPWRGATRARFSALNSARRAAYAIDENGGLIIACRRDLISPPHNGISIGKTACRDFVEVVAMLSLNQHE
jgi:hypothetical protein